VSQTSDWRRLGSPGPARSLPFFEALLALSVGAFRPHLIAVVIFNVPNGGQRDAEETLTQLIAVG
jgi:hypothetical protein